MNERHGDKRAENTNGLGARPATGWAPGGLSLPSYLTAGDCNEVAGVLVI